MSMNSPTSFRVERANSLGQVPSSSFFRRLQGKKDSFKTSDESTRRPPRPSHRRILSRDRKRSLVIYYSSNSLTSSNDSNVTASTRCEDTLISDGEISEDEDRFETPDLASSMGFRDSLTGRSRGALLRMSQTFSRGIDNCSDGRRRAAKQSTKYGVTWRKDDESECCQVCYAMFTKLSRRRHHCRVCGELVCGACSQAQVALTDKFTSPRRACVACCTLLQAMARAGDNRVQIVESKPASPAKRHHHHLSDPFAPTFYSPASALLPAPSATPRYRDRLTEVRRVMAAGEVSRRRGSSEKKMFVISSRWLRSWLAFTSSASSSSCTLDYGFDSETSTSTLTNEEADKAPGPIDNLSLLEFSRGKLVRRPGLIRDEIIAGVASAGEDADFQLLSPEVWEIFLRLYGGAPSIYVDLESEDPTAWIVDVSGLLSTNTSGNGLKTGPNVEHVLTRRHAGVLDAVRARDVRTSSNQTAHSIESYTPLSCHSTISTSKHQPLKSPVWTITSSSSCSLSEEKDRARSPKAGGKVVMEDFESSVAILDEEDDMRVTTATRSPTAVLAASAFAVAMKQARMNAQKAIDDRASRVIST